MKRKIFIILSVFICVFLLAGCYSQDYSLIIRQDGSSDFEIKIVTDRDTYNLLESYDIKTTQGSVEQDLNSPNLVDQCDVLFQEIASIFNQYGFEVSPISDTVEVGFKAKKTYPTIQEFNDEIKIMYEENIIGLNGEIRFSETIFKKQYVFSGEVHYLYDYDISDEAYKVLSNEELYNISNMTADVFVVIPGNIIATDGNYTGDRTTWTQTYSKDNSSITVRIASEIQNKNLYFIAGAIGLILLIIISVFVSRFIRSKQSERNKKNYEQDEFDMDS